MAISIVTVRLYIREQEKKIMSQYFYDMFSRCMAMSDSVCETQALSVPPGLCLCWHRTLSVENGHNGEAPLVDRPMFVHRPDPVPSRMWSGEHGWGPGCTDGVRYEICTVVLFKYGLIP